MADRNETAEAVRKAREARLAAELRANLQKRKAQGRARRGGDEDARSGLSQAPDSSRPDGEAGDT